MTPMASKGSPLFVLAALAALVTSAVATDAVFSVVYKDLDVTQTAIIESYAKAADIKSYQIVLQSQGGSTVTFDNIDFNQVTSLQEVAFVLKCDGSQTIMQSSVQINDAGRRLLTSTGPPPSWTVSFNYVDLYQKNFLEQTVKALNLWGHQTVAQAAVQSNTAGPKGPPPPAKYTVDVKDVDITQINVLTQLAVAINIGGNQTIIQNATQSNTVGK